MSATLELQISETAVEVGLGPLFLTTYTDLNWHPRDRVEFSFSDAADTAPTVWHKWVDESASLSLSEGVYLWMRFVVGTSKDTERTVTVTTFS